MRGRRHRSRDERTWALVRRQHGVVARRQLRELGWSAKEIAHRVARRRLHTLHRGVYAVGRPDVGRLGTLMAAVLACGPAAVLSHTSAAELWRVCNRREGEIHISVPGDAVRRRPGIVVHRRGDLDRTSLTVEDGIPITRPVGTLIDLATMISERRLEAAINEADKHDLVDPERLRGALESHRGQPGVAIVRRLLDRHTFTLTDSELERLFLPIVRSAGLPPPLTQQRVNSFKVDFFWPDLGLVVETDGLRYHRTAAEQVLDRRRRRRGPARPPPNLRVMNELPRRVRIREVGPRDGFQNEPEVIATAEKVRLIGMLGAAGLERIELTSFVRPDVIAQLADAEQVLTAYERLDGIAYSVLIPNERGLERALALRERFDEVNLFLSASETHNRKNVNRPVAESLAEIERVTGLAGAEGLRCEGVISTSFGCPYEGEVPAERVLGIAERLAGAGCEEVAFGDTTGMANPRQVGEFFRAARERLPGIELTAHFHNTRGQALANALAALEQGIDSFESAFGELGGCPVPPGATGNVATEDLVSMLEEMGVSTGVDLGRLLEASGAVRELLGRPLGAHVLTAGPVEWAPQAGAS